MSGRSKLRVVFMGTPEFAVPALRLIAQAGHDVVAVYTRAPAPKGRGQQVQKSPVHLLADAHGIPVFTPLSLKKSLAAQEEFARIAPDVAVVAAYGLILPPEVLAAPKFGCLNIHASLLPRWRGASPIQHAIWQGDAETGVTIMQMEEGLDTGPMIRSACVKIDVSTTAPALHDALSAMGANLIVSVLADLVAGTPLPRTPQPEIGVTYAPLLKKEDGVIDWTQEAGRIDRQVRALNPWPGTTARLPSGESLKILAVTAAGAAPEPPGTVIDRTGLIACGKETSLRLVQVQTPSGKRVSGTDLINGGWARVEDRLA